MPRFAFWAHSPYAEGMTLATPFVFGPYHLEVEPLSDAAGPVRLVWLHGWGLSRESLRPLAHSLLNVGETWLIDLPGHGTSPPPTTAASPAAMADAVCAWLATLPPVPTYLIGHSMGFRVAVHAASRGGAALAGLVALAGAGVPRPLAWRARLRRTAIRALIGIARHMSGILGPGLLAHLRARFGSADYLACPAALKPTFLAVVNDTVAGLAPQISLPTLLIYGDHDDATPPDVGQTFARLFPHATLHVLPHQTHHSLLNAGRHVVGRLIRSFVAAPTA